MYRKGACTERGSGPIIGFAEEGIQPAESSQPLPEIISVRSFANAQDGTGPGRQRCRFWRRINGQKILETNPLARGLGRCHYDENDHEYSDI